MQLTCDKTLLTDALSICLHAVAAKSTIQTLEGVLLSAKPGQLTISGFNTQMGIQRTIEAECDGSADFVMPAHMFFEVIRKLRGETVKIEIDNDFGATISSGKSVFNMRGEDGEEFPELPTVNKRLGVSLPSNLMRQMIGDTIYAISTNENKPVHTGSKFEVEKNCLRVISIDGYRLAVRQEEVETTADESFSFIVPGSTLKELSRILPDSDEPVHIYPSGKHGLFEFNETIVTTRLLEGDFLDFRTAVPNDMPIKMDLDKAAVVDAVERVSIVVTERLKNPIRCLFEGESLKLSCVTSMGRAFDEIQIPFFENSMEIGFNSRYLLDALRACPDEGVIMELKSGLSPVVFKPAEGEKFIYMVLPVRLKAEGI